jgi:histidyl-tRNA synthetase
MIPDSECITIMTGILRDLDVGQFCIKVNHRKLLDGIFSVCGVPAGLFTPICSAVDKLDKLPWKDVRAEMTMKGLDEAAADKIGEFVAIKGEAKAVLEQLQAHTELMAHTGAASAVNDLEKLFRYLSAMGSAPNCVLDLSLARGLSYYTGVIFEAVLQDSAVHVGSVGGGGRYDELVGVFKKKGDIPCVGFSIGVERLFTVMQKLRAQQPAPSNSSVLVCSIENGALLERMQLTAELWEAGIAAEFVLKDAPKIQAQLKFAENSRIPLAVIFGPEELEKKEVKVKILAKSEQHVVPRAEMAEFIKAQLK